MKNIIFIAPPAAGKGTQAKLVSEEYNIPHISTGDLLREEIVNGSELGKQIKEVINQGNLVTDEIITDLLRKRITAKDCQNGYILDGYPRTLTQAKIYDNLLKELKYDKGIVIFFDINKDLAAQRTINRIICPNCGSSYNLLIDELKPQKENTCDRCQHQLHLRNDDTIEIFNHRFDTYINSTKDLIEYYRKLNLLYCIKVEEKSAQQIFEEVKRIIND